MRCLYCDEAPAKILDLDVLGGEKTRVFCTVKCAAKYALAVHLNHSDEVWCGGCSRWVNDDEPCGCGAGTVPRVTQRALFG